MSYKDILNPIIVNEKGEIIEGQHRFTARRELGLPIIFFVVEGLGSEEMQILNQSKSKSSWDHEDYLDHYVQQGLKDYIVFDEIYKKYELNFMDLLHIICELSDSEIGEKEMATLFDEGKFQMTGREYAIDYLEELSLFNKFNFRRHTSFVRAFFKLYLEDFYDKEYMRKRIDIKEFDLIKLKKSTITEFGKFLAENLYSDFKRNIDITYSEESGCYGQIIKGNAGKGRRNGKKKKLIMESIQQSKTILS